MRRGLEVVNHLNGLGLEQLPNANYPSESLKVWYRHKEAASVTLYLPSLPTATPPPPQPTKQKAQAQRCTEVNGSDPLDRWQQSPHTVASLLSSISQSKDSGPHPSRAYWLLRANPKREGVGGDYQRAGDERGTDLDVWLENKKVVQSTGSWAIMPICPS